MDAGDGICVEKFQSMAMVVVGRTAKEILTVPEEGNYGKHNF